MGKPIMIQGTASGVGKTILTLALCRIFKKDGYTVAPFKAQNMTSNTVFMESGDEIAGSQWLQALAAGIVPDANMNPVLLKYTPGKQGSEIVVRGKHFDTISTYGFKDIKKQLVPEIMEAYFCLREGYDIVVIEGAGSPVELNLNHDDLVNMGMAKRAKSPVVLVADIDRGGVFASLYGTINLMNETERGYVKATIVNRFKGEPSYFGEGVKMIEDITKLPVAGVVPFKAINLPEEDSLFDSAEYVEQSTDFESQFDDIADHVRKSIDMDLIYKILDNGV